MVKDYITNVINPLLAETELTAATCNLTSKKHKSARSLIEHLTFFQRPSKAEVSSLKPGMELLDTVAFDAPSLETFHEINEELGSIYAIYMKKM